MVRIYIDNQPFEANGEVNLLQACLSLGFNIPYFCWHPALGAVGACRQCAVKMFRDENDTRGRIVMSCMMPVIENMRISIDDPDAIEFRRSVIEWLMTNHPHDCPVCDEGGHCHLQDMTVMTGHDYRRYRFPKRTYRNQDLGPFVAHEMNRCIQCYRCVRFYCDYAGGRDLNVFGAHNHVYFGRQQDGALESPFSGNLAEICPTGVFTDKTLAKHYTRKWDLQMAPSVCVHCGVGCNTTPGERYGKLRRIENRFNGSVNGYFLCDRGRFGYEFVNHRLRLRHPLARAEKEGPLEPVAAETARAQFTEMLKSARGVIGIGSPRGSLESNYALQALVGAENFYSGMAAGEQKLIQIALELLKKSPACSPSLKDIERSDAVLILGEDVTNSAPMMALSLRQSVRNQPLEKAAKMKIPAWLDASARNIIQLDKGPFFIVSATATGLDDIATECRRAAPADIARLAIAVADAVTSGVSGGDKLAAKIADALKTARQPLVVAGPSLGSAVIIQAAAAIAGSLVTAGKPAQLAFAAPECNNVGAALLGGRPIEDAFEAVREGRADTVIIVENDIERRIDASACDELFQKARVIAIDHLMNATVKRADLALPAGTYAESDGTLVNYEGRAQRFYRVFAPQGDIHPGWCWLRDAIVSTGQGEPWENFEAVQAAIAREYPELQKITEIAPPASLRIAGNKMNRQPHRYSGRTAMFANVTVHEPKPPDDPDAPLSFSMEGVQGPPQPMPPAPVVPFFWAPGWNSSMQAINKFQQEVGGPLRGGDPGRRLIEPASGAAPASVPNAPEPFTPRPGEWLIVPIEHVFGSEELSAHAPGIAARALEPYVAIGTDDYEALGLSEGDSVQLSLAGIDMKLIVRLDPALPRGVAGVARLASTAQIKPGDSARLEKAAR